jgi:perosamine synthetase
MNKIKNTAEFIPMALPDLTGNERMYLMDAFDSTWISSQGKYITRLEQEFASFCGATGGVATSNGTVAIHWSRR